MLNELLKANYIKFGVKAKDKDDALTKISEFALEQGIIDNVEQFKQGMLEREAIDSTGFGGQIAIPHAKVPTVKFPALMVVKFTDGIEWESMDDEPVKVAFAIAVPDSSVESSNTHIDILASLARKLMHDDLRIAIHNSKTEKELEEIIKR